MKYRNILFDLDGTLTDPKEGITNSVKYALEKFGIIETDTEKLTPFIGPPLKESFEKFYNFSEEESLKAVKYYRDYFAEKGILENMIFPEVPELLEWLKDSDCRIILATSKPTVFAEKILVNYNIIEFFQDVVGSNLDGTMSDKTAIINYIVEKHKLKKSETVMVGDRRHDIIGAVNNDVDSIGILFGYGSKEELKEAGASYIVKDFSDLKGTFLQK